MRAFFRAGGLARRLLDLEFCQRLAGGQCFGDPARLAATAAGPGFAGGAAVFGCTLGRRDSHAALGTAHAELQIGGGQAIFGDLFAHLLDDARPFLIPQVLGLLSQLRDLLVVFLDLRIDVGKG